MLISADIGIAPNLALMMYDAVCVLCIIPRFSAEDLSWTGVES